MHNRAKWFDSFTLSDTAPNQSSKRTWQYACAATHSLVHVGCALHWLMANLQGGYAAFTAVWTALLMSLWLYAKSAYAPYWIAGSVSPLPVQQTIRMRCCLETMSVHQLSCQHWASAPWKREGCNTGVAFYGTFCVVFQQAGAGVVTSYIDAGTL